MPELPPAFTEEGSFAFGMCDSCDFRGPARRARKVAEEDAALHRLTGCDLPPVVVSDPRVKGHA